MGKGLSKDAKAQKLAFQHWIEAVIILSIGFVYFQFSLSFGFLCSFVMMFWACRLIHGIGMGIACMCIMKNGVKQMLVSHSFTGKPKLQLFFFFVCKLKPKPWKLRVKVIA